MCCTSFPVILSSANCKSRYHVLYLYGVFRSGMCYSACSQNPVWLGINDERPKMAVPARSPESHVTAKDGTSYNSY